MKILYIAGLAHSGSTYLSRVLNQHSDIFSSGEIVFLPSSTSGSISCDCTGNDGSECEFWPDVLNRISFSEQQITRTARLSMDRRWEWIKAITQSFEDEAEQAFSRLNRTFFNAVSSESDADVIIDASKTIWRALPLWKSLPEHVHVLHLVKSPDNQLESRMRMGYNFWHSLFMKYVRKNKLYHYFFSDRETYKRVVFENLVNNPKETVRSIHEWLNLDYEFPFEKPHKPFHHLQGNAQVKGNLDSLRPRKEKLETHRSFTRIQRWALDRVRQSMYNPLLKER